jgi:hypothetical protein
MKLKFSATLFLVVVFLGFMMDYNSEIESYLKTETNQPPPLILDPDSTFKLQPIVENIDLKGYEVIFSFKLYYKDKMVKPINLKKGPPIDGYCSDLTIITFYLENQDSVKIESVKRMSCHILAIFNLTKEQNNKLRTYPMKSVKVLNYVTENQYTFPINDNMYWNRWINKYNNWH